MKEFAVQPQHSASTTPVETKPGVIGFATETLGEFSDDDVMTQAAALAFYSGLALAPLLTIAAWIARGIFGDQSKAEIVDAFGKVAGNTATQPIGALLNPASDEAAKGLTVAGIVSILLVAISASGVFAQLQSALNVVWDVKAKPGAGIMDYVRKRLFSLGMLLSILFLLMLSVVVSAALQAFMGEHESSSSVVWTVTNFVIGLAVFWGLFAALFKYVPDVKVGWRPILVGAGVSAALFSLGRFGLAFYLGRGSYETTYGSAVGSFVALLVWVYYSAIILLIGAEVTQVYARRNGERVESEAHAVRVMTKTKEIV